jgi:hypothetical protein
MKTLQLNSITNFKFQTMKTMKNISIYALLSIAMIGCSDDDAPEVVNEEELITTVILTLTTEDGEVVELKSTDLDGVGGDYIEYEIIGDFSPNTQYQGAVQFLNETEDPVEDITEEVIEEADEHQVFYEIQEGLNIDIMYNDDQQDSQGNPIGVQIILTTGEASTGILKVTLKHEPNKSAEGVSDGNITNAGGETDITTDFDVSF